MFMIFEEENKPLSERAKVDELLSKVQSSGLSAAVAQLRYQLNTTGITFTVAANHLNSEVSQTPDYQLSRRINATNRTGHGGHRGGGRGDGRGFQGRGASRGTTPHKTTYYSTTEWEKLSYEERDRVRKEHDKKGEQGGSKRTISEMTTKQLASAIISSIKAAAVSDSGTCDDDKSDTPKKSNAGNSFGGRESAKRSKSDRLEIAAFRSSHRKPLPPHQLSMSVLTQLAQRAAKCELDSHADTCALVCNFLPLYFTGRVCNVIPYNAGAYEPERDIPIVCGATAFTFQQSGETFILIINEGLYFGNKLEHSRLNPNQLRFSGVVVNDNPFDKAAPLSISTTEIDIPLQISGTNIFLETTTPTQRELDTCTHIHLICDTEWNPQTVNLSLIQSVEVEDTIGVEPFLSQISSIYCFKEMVEALRDVRYINRRTGLLK